MTLTAWLGTAQWRQISDSARFSMSTSYFEGLRRATTPTAYRVASKFS